MTKYILALGVCLLPVLSAADSFGVTFYQKTVVAGKELPPGEYRVKVEGNKAVISKGRDVVEAPVRVETTDAKYRGTSVRYMNGDGVYKLDEIRVRNSRTKLVFDHGNQAGS